MLHFIRALMSNWNLVSFGKSNIFRDKQSVHWHPHDKLKLTKLLMHHESLKKNAYIKLGKR